MSRILISGYYGFNNAGDDTVLYGIISSLKNHDPQVDLAVLSNNPKETEQLFGITAFNRWNIKEITRELKQADLLLMGGGSLLQDATSPRSVIYYLGIVTLAKLLKKPVVFYAQGIGPITKNFSKQLIKMIVDKVDIITVRDHQSGEDLKSLGVKKAPIHVTADPALIIPPSQIPLEIGESITAEYHVDNKKKTVGISVRDWKNEKRYKKEIAKMADQFISMDWNVIFIPMQYPSDVSASKEILKEMNNTGAVLIEKQLGFKEIISLIGNMDFVLGMRLHSIILAAVMNVPFVGISYDPKIDRFVERIGMKSAGDIQEISYESILKAVSNEIEDLEESKKRLQHNIQSVIDAAEKSTNLTLDVLNKKQT